VAAAAFPVARHPAGCALDSGEVTKREVEMLSRCSRVVGSFLYPLRRFFPGCACDLTGTSCQGLKDPLTVHNYWCMRTVSADRRGYAALKPLYKIET
jgi:hypothetical protein